MLARVCLLGLLSLTSGRSSPGWSQRSLSRYLRARAGADERQWQGQGSLINTVTGETIAEVLALERCARSAATSSERAAFESERILLYCEANGTRLSRYRGRAVPILRYTHNVSYELSAGSLLLRARNAGGSVIASAHGLGRGPVRTGLRRAYELALRAVPLDSAAETLPSVPTAGVPQAAAPRTAGTIREEYRLVEPLCPGGACSLDYRRTGKCPHWYGVGLCTLEIKARSEPAWARWWRRARRRPSLSWEQRADAMLQN